MGMLSRIYEGTVMHQRLRPQGHKFTYRVFSMLFDLDEIDALDRSLRLFSRNRFNLFSFHDRDYAGEGCTDTGAKVRSMLAEMGFGDACARIWLLCYPRLLGYVFNPLSVYYCHNAAGELKLIVYEVTNTHHERKWYVIPAEPRGEGTYAQTCEKELYVSPFTTPTGNYEFRMIAPGRDVFVGVNLIEPDGRTLLTYFRGEERPITDRGLLGLWLRYPLMTLKVTVAIHFEAARLWLKGVKVQDRLPSPKFSFSIYNSQTKEVMHVR
ncbi:MAG: DUF1365 domain-containing protein [Alphaproteobacteria bacterium]|jgi:DUF1365 family protein